MNGQVIVESGVTWVEVVGLIVAVIGLIVAVGIAVGAFLAYFQTKRQIHEAARQHVTQLTQAASHHTEQLTSMLRPVVVLRQIEGGLWNFGDRVASHIEAWVENVGPGPAMQVTLLGWVRVPDAKPFDAARRLEIENMKGEIDIKHPEFTIQLGAIGTNHCLGPISLAPTLPDQVPVTDFAEQAAVMIYIFTYQDVFENQRPSTPPEDWFLGDLTFNKPGTWERLRNRNEPPGSS